MLCQDCQEKEATIQYAEIVESGVEEIALCRECYDAGDSEQDAGFSIAADPRSTGSLRNDPIAEVRKLSEEDGGAFTIFFRVKKGASTANLEEIIRLAKDEGGIPSEFSGWKKMLWNPKSSQSMTLGLPDVPWKEAGVSFLAEFLTQFKQLSPANRRKLLERLKKITDEAA